MTRKALKRKDFEEKGFERDLGEGLLTRGGF